MNRYTLANFRARFPQEAFGCCQADPQVRNYCNRATERLMMDPLAPEGGWYGTWVRMAFSVSVSSGSAYIVTPREVARITDIAACQQPLHIRNQYYEFLKYSSGLKPSSCSPNCETVFQAYERGNVPTLSDLLATPQTIRIYPVDSRDVGLRVLVQGKDANGQTVLTTDPGTGQSAPGEYLVLRFPYVDSANTFSSITGIMKDQTYGPIQIFQVDPTTLAEVTLSGMEPNEQSGWYRKYLLNAVPAAAQCCTTSPTLQITALCQLDFIAVENETDYLLIPNVEALILEARALRFENMDSPSAAQQALVFHGKAIASLNGQLDMYEGKNNPAVRVSLFGSNPLCRQPV